MRLLANENIPGVAVESLRSHGHDVLWVREQAPGLRDEEVVRRATDEARVLLTFDKDFGELAFRRGLPASSGVILCRFLAPSAHAVAERIIAALASRTDWVDHFSVIEEDRIRMSVLQRPDTT